MTMQLSKRISLRQICLATACSTVVLGLGGIHRADATPTTFYKENYTFCTGSIGKDAAAETGWIGLKSGLPQGKFSNLKVFAYGSSLIGGAVNSAPQGKSQGYSFWFRPTYGVTILTAEMGFDVSLISSSSSLVQYEQRLSGVDEAGTPNQTQLAFLIDSTWYISKEAFRQAKPGVWEPVKTDPSKLTYGTVPYVNGLGPELPTSFNTELPSKGRVKAFGVFLTEINGRVRIDNFTLATTAEIPSGMKTAIQETSVAGCPAASPDVTGGGGPQPTPNPDDGDGGVDQEKPTETPPPGVTPVPQAAKFCPTREQGAGVKVRISPRAAKVFVKGNGVRGRVALRNQAIAQLYASHVLPIGALVNIRMGDYDKTQGTLTMTVRKGVAPVKVKLSKGEQATLNRYQAILGKGRSATDPLFVAVARGGKSLTTTQAVCSRELRAMVSKRAQSVRIPLHGLFSAK